MKNTFWLIVVAVILLPACTPMMNQNVYRETVCTVRNGVRNCQVVERIVETNDPDYGGGSGYLNVAVGGRDGFISLGGGSGYYGGYDSFAVCGYNHAGQPLRCAGPPAPSAFGFYGGGVVYQNNYRPPSPPPPPPRHEKKHNRHHKK
jgi:hypothetical protein